VADGGLEVKDLTEIAAAALGDTPAQGGGRE